MRKTVTLILSIFIAAQILCGQSFFKSYETLDISSRSIEQLSDGSYIIGGSSGGFISILEKLSVSKFDSLGNLIWHRVIDAKHNRTNSKNIEILSDNSIVLTGTKDSAFVVHRLDKDGNILWSKEFTSSEGEMISLGKAEESANGDIFVAALIKSSNKIIVYSLSNNGNINFSKDISPANLNISNSDINSSSFVKIDDDLYVITVNEKMIALSSSMEKLWENSSAGRTVIKSRDGKIITAGDVIRKIDKQGNILWIQNQIPRSVDIAAQKNDGLLYFKPFSRGSLFITNELGDLIETIFTDFAERGLSINNTSDNRIVLSGLYKGHFAFTKLNGFNKAIEIVSPNGGERLPNRSSFQVIWNSFNIDSFDIDFSSNGGSNWNRFVASYLTTHNYTTPELVQSLSEQCLIRIRDSADSTIFDTSDSVFSIIFYHEYDYIAANQVKMWMGNNGLSSHNPYSDDAGFYWPGGEEATITSIFVDGFLIGGKLNGEVRVHGSNYRYGLTPGNIKPDGTAGDSFDPAHQLFKIKKEIPITSSDDEKLKYELMYNNWPVAKGAPWWDLNGDGKFTRSIDKPALLGNEVLFYVSNDLDSQRTKFLYGSPPVGLEFQTTVFASDDPEVEDAVFKKIKVINKSGETFEDVYISCWTDDDLGDANDDFIGCDTTLNLGYTYNGDEDDHDYYGTTPPAVGHLLIQGPKIPAEPEDSALYSNGWIKGYKNLPITAFHLYIGSNTTYSDPDLGVYAGSIQMYNQMQGKLWNGDPIIDPTTGNPTTYCLYGDPVEETGWYEGQGGWPGNAPSPDDRSYLMSSGPFTMAPGDAQEVVFAIYMARGSDRLNSVTKLKEKAVDLIDYYFNEIPKLNSENQNLFPNEFSVSNNYPNPFNASTTIEFNLPVIEGIGKTSLRTVVKVYDILGRELKTLLNKELLPGPHKIEFNGNGLASGVYLLRFEAEGGFQTIKKIMFLK